MSESKTDAREGCYILVLMVHWSTHDEQLKETLKRKDCLDWTIECAWDSDHFTFIGLTSKQPYGTLDAVKEPCERVIRSIQTDVGEKGNLSLVSFQQIIGMDTIGGIN